MIHTKKNGGARDAILHAALKVISRLGYADASVASIAKEAGVNNVTVYRLFDNKENLFREVIDAFADVRFDETALDDALERAEGDTETVLTVLASAYFEAVFQNIDIIRIFIVEAPHFDFVSRAAWYMPPAVVRHCRKRLALAPPVAGMGSGERDRITEMFVAHIVRRAMEYNKHDSIWDFTPELAENFRIGVRPQIDLLLRLFANRIASVV